MMTEGIFRKNVNITEENKLENEILNLKYEKV
jgi:hypothetical protein